MRLRQTGTGKGSTLAQAKKQNKLLRQRRGFAGTFACAHHDKAAQCHSSKPATEARQVGHASALRIETNSIWLPWRQSFFNPNAVLSLQREACNSCTDVAVALCSLLEPNAHSWQVAVPACTWENAGHVSPFGSFPAHSTSPGQTTPQVHT